MARMTAEEYHNYEEPVSFRLFKTELRQLDKIVKYRILKGQKRYENRSHAIRCAIMRLIREEYPYVAYAKGRPKCK